MSGYTDEAMMHHGIPDSGAPFLQEAVFAGGAGAEGAGSAGVPGVGGVILRAGPGGPARAGSRTGGPPHGGEHSQSRRGSA